MDREAKHATYLLTKTDTRTGVERQEDVRVGNDVFLHSLVEETIGIELKC